MTSKKPSSTLRHLRTVKMFHDTYAVEGTYKGKEIYEEVEADTAHEAKVRAAMQIDNREAV